MEEDIDNETLQAQIDLSLSFAQNLAASWVKPSSKPTKNSSSALEAELKEYMRRPPRLGVGAPIPEVATSSRETERLKSRLSGKGSKRTRGEDDNDPASKQLSDAEEDSRGASIKKKARIDPFEAGRKKKKKDAPTLPTPRLTSPEQKTVVKEISTEKTASEDVPRTSEPSSSTISPSKRKKKKHKNKNPLQLVTESESMHGPNKTLPENVNGHNGSSIPEGAEALPVTEVFDISLISTPTSPISSARRSQDSPLLKGPILNLTGPPPSDDDSDEEGEPGTPSTSPKKKRRKRKKKKSLLGANHGL